jgi:IS5 family transposase
LEDAGRRISRSDAAPAPDVKEALQDRRTTSSRPVWTTDPVFKKSSYTFRASATVSTLGRAPAGSSELLLTVETQPKTREPSQPFLRDLQKGTAVPKKRVPIHSPKKFDRIFCPY